MNPTAMQVISRAMVAGALGGILAAIFAVTIGEGSINAAIEIEEAGEVLLAGEIEEEPLVTRGVQAYIGLPVAGILLGGFAGLAYGTVFSAVRHRIPAQDDFRRSIILGGMAFIALALVPAIKYPANPPAVGNPDTVGQRSLYFFTLVTAGVVLAAGIAIFHRWVTERHDQSTAATLTGLTTVIGYALLMVVWPDTPDTVPDDFPGTLLWEFRLQSLTTLALIFAALGIGTGLLLTRSQTEVPADVA